MVVHKNLKSADGCAQIPSDFQALGVKSTIKTKVQFGFARLVPYGPLSRTCTMWTLKFTVHAKEPGKVTHVQADYNLLLKTSVKDCNIYNSELDI